MGKGVEERDLMGEMVERISSHNISTGEVNRLSCALLILGVQRSAGIKGEIATLWAAMNGACKLKGEDDLVYVRRICNA